MLPLLSANLAFWSFNHHQAYLVSQPPALHQIPLQENKSLSFHFSLSLKEKKNPLLAFTKRPSTETLSLLRLKTIKIGGIVLHETTPESCKQLGLSVLSLLEA